MKTTIRRMLLTTALLALVALTAAPAQASGVAVSPDCDAPRPPDYWVYACAEPSYSPFWVWAYGVDTTPETERVCPALGICADVPKPLKIVYEKEYLVPYYVVRHQEHIDHQQVIEDTCNILDPLCTAVGSLETTSSSMPYDLVYEAAVDLSGDLVNDHALFSLPSGEYVVLPLVA